MKGEEIPPEAKQLLEYLEFAKKQREESMRMVNKTLFRLKTTIFISNVLPFILLCGLIAFLFTHDFKPSVNDSRADYFESLKGGE